MDHKEKIHMRVSYEEGIQFVLRTINIQSFSCEFTRGWGFILLPEKEKNGVVNSPIQINILTSIAAEYLA